MIKSNVEVLICLQRPGCPAGAYQKATTIICLATQLHTIATGNMTPSYQVVNGIVRPVYFYTVDISEFVVNKLKDRGCLSSKSIITNIQDFVVNLQRNLS